MKTNCATVLAIIIICLLLQTSGLHSQNDTSTYISNGDKYIAEQLFNKRIVMLADIAHHTSTSLHTIFQVLEEWYNIILPADKKCKLTLILEYSDYDINKIDTYLNSGTTEDLVNAVSILENIEDLEQLSDLRNFILKLNESEAFKKGKIKFTIKGFEPVGGDFSADFNRKTRVERDRWFIDERDSLTAKGIIDYMNKNPEEKVLMFYGGAHLNKNLTRKDLHTYITRDSSLGYFLAHYLKKEFGDENVLTVNQIADPGSHFNETLPFQLRGNEAYINSSKIPWKLFNPENYDAFIIRKSYLNFLPHSLGLMLSRSLTEKFIVYLKDLETKDKLYAEQCMSIPYTGFLFGTKFSDISAMELWYNSFKNKITPDSLNSAEITERLYSQFYKDTSNNNILFVYHKFGFTLEPLFPKPDTVKWKNEIWPVAVKHMKFIAYLANFWIGNDDEKIQAKKYLTSFSGEDFSEAVQYFKWYRKKYYNYDF